MLAVTTFPNGASYAKRFLKSVVKYWPGGLIAYTDGDRPVIDDKITYYPVYNIPGLKWFIENAPKHPPSYMFDAGRFAHKAYAQLDVMPRHLPMFYWLDADIVFHRPVPEWFLEAIVEDHALAYLGRKGSYTETGMIGFNTTHPDFGKFESAYRRMYDDQKIYELEFWTDCHAFDAARKGVAGHNLSPDGKGVEHVFVTSAFGRFADHRKGPRKKMDKSPEHPYL